VNIFVNKNVIFKVTWKQITESTLLNKNVTQNSFQLFITGTSRYHPKRKSEPPKGTFLKIHIGKLLVTCLCRIISRTSVFRFQFHVVLTATSGSYRESRYARLNFKRLDFFGLSWLSYSYKLVKCCLSVCLCLCLDVNRCGKIVTAAHRDL